MVAVHLEVCVHLNLKNKNKPAYNSVLAIGGVSFSKENFANLKIISSFEVHR